jgi:hypothetical protein
MFHLGINYRSHGGIVNCAHSVIEIIGKFWPYKIDILAQERGIVDGPRPTFFRDQDESSTCEQFFLGTK